MQSISSLAHGRWSAFLQHARYGNLALGAEGAEATSQMGRVAASHKPAKEAGGAGRRVAIFRDGEGERDRHSPLQSVQRSHHFSTGLALATLEKRSPGVRSL